MCSLVTIIPFFVSIHFQCQWLKKHIPLAKVEYIILETDNIGLHDNTNMMPHYCKKALGESTLYTGDMMKTCLQRIVVNIFNPEQSRLIE
jgi:hypothetical protein